jgi:hypothetical protein
MAIGGPRDVGHVDARLDEQHGWLSDRARKRERLVRRVEQRDVGLVRQRDVRLVRKRIVGKLVERQPVERIVVEQPAQRSERVSARSRR